jgi:cytochrome c oxidase subunit 2
MKKILLALLLLIALFWIVDEAASGFRLDAERAKLKQEPLAAQNLRVAAGTAMAGPRVIDITAKRFAFTPSEITLKKGQPVILRLTSQDVTHGFFMKKLKIDEIIEPGKPAEVRLTPDTAGRFTTICDHFCGSGHGNMNMTIVVEE